MGLELLPDDGRRHDPDLPSFEIVGLADGKVSRELFEPADDPVEADDVPARQGFIEAVGEIAVQHAEQRFPVGEQEGQVQHLEGGVENLHVGGGNRQHFQRPGLDHLRHLEPGSEQLGGENLDLNLPLAPFLHELLEIQGPVVVGALLGLIMSELDIPLGRGRSRSRAREGEKERRQESHDHDSFHTFLLMYSF